MILLSRVAEWRIFPGIRQRRPKAASRGLRAAKPDARLILPVDTIIHDNAESPSLLSQLSTELLSVDRRVNTAVRIGPSHSSAGALLTDELMKIGERHLALALAPQAIQRFEYYAVLRP